jgi:DNA-binding beta-propeller fold protein YncE
MRHPKLLTALFGLLCGFSGSNLSATDPINLPNGLTITPDAAPRSVVTLLNPGLRGRRDLTLGQAVTTALSPDGNTLLVLTSGYNKDGPQKFDEYVFVFDTTVYPPRQMQAVPVPNSFCGLAWNPNGSEFYVSGGMDDRIYVFAKTRLGMFSRAAAIPLGHSRANDLFANLPAPLNAAAAKPIVAGISVNASGSAAVVANFYNDSISIIDLGTRKKTAELDLRPGVNDRAKSGVPGGEYPFWTAVQGDVKVYVSSPRDREIVVVQLGSTPSIATRIPVRGQPNRILLNRAQDRLFVALDNADAVAVISTDSDRVLAQFNVTAPAGFIGKGNVPKGANPNGLALSPDERTLYVSDGGTNDIAVAAVDASGAGRVIGLIPTGWYPNSVSVSADGKTLYVVNGKSIPGPNVGNCRGNVNAPGIADCSRTPNQYVYSLEKASLLSLPVPPPAELDALTRRVAANNHFDLLARASGNTLISELRTKIQHVIYVIKENRTYDQVLGDLEVGDGDPSIAEFPEPITPNHHSLARKFVTLDNFMDSGEVSGVGWNWSTGARTTDFTEKTVPVNYAGRGFKYDWEGVNRDINVAFGSLPERIKAQPILNNSPSPADPNLLPGDADVAAPDSQDGEAGAGYLWDEVLAAGLTLRNYGVFCDLARYENPRTNPGYIPIARNPFAEQVVQAVPAKKALFNNTDLYFRSFDQNNADFFLFQEWQREFDEYVTNKNLPSLSLVRLAHDHFGDFGTALYGINTPGLQIADNDYAVALLVQKVANSPYKDNTLIFVVEDDAQDGPDHVDAHRSIAYVVGPYVKQGAVISERYNTVSMVRTIEALLGLTPSSLYSAVAEPMTAVFDLSQSNWSYNAIVPELLRTSQLPLPRATAENSLPRTQRVLVYAKDRHSAAYWQRHLGDMDYDVEDKLDTVRFNRELWKGMMGNKPYPRSRSGKNLRENRELTTESAPSEDKEAFVRPLAERLKRIGLNVRYDEFSLRVGDALRKAIEHGLSRSRLGL